MAVGGATISYMIGNSLTMDCDPELGIAKLAADSQRYLFPGLHILGGNSLINIYNNPTVFEVIQGGYFTQAIPARPRQVLVLQPFYMSSTLATDISSITALADLFFTTNPTGFIYIYAAWPGNPGAYGTYWTGAVVNNPSTATVHKRDYFAYLYSSMDALYPGKIRIIPIGEVLNNIEVEALAGRIPSLYAPNYLYRDSAHLGSTGRFVAASTVIACLFHHKTAASAGTITHYETAGSSAYTAGGGSVVLTTGVAAIMETIVWDIVRADSRTGV